jgi:hypothetical protein
MKKKILTLILTVASLGFVGSLNDTKANTAVGAKPQIRIQIGRQRYRRRDYDRDWRSGYNSGYGYRTETRLVQRGWHTYRETYQIRYSPYGGTEATLISRVRVD